MQTSVGAVSFRQWCMFFCVAVLLTLTGLSQPFADDCFTYSTFWAMLCGIYGAAFLPQWLWRCSSRLCFVDSGFLTASTLGFYQGQDVYGVIWMVPFSLVCSSRCGVADLIMPSCFTDGTSALVFCQASACALGFFPRTVYGTFIGAVLFRMQFRQCSCVDVLIILPGSSWFCSRSCKVVARLCMCFVALRTSSQTLHAWCFADGSQQCSNVWILYRCLVSS